MKSIILSVLMFVCCAGLLGQEPNSKQTVADKNKRTVKLPETPTQPIDAPYTESILKNTTDKMFLTELVNYLPASAKVPSPEKVLGYPVGTPNKLTYTKDQYRYYRELEKATPRVKVFLAPEKSEEGRDQMLIVVGDEANLAKLARYKEITGKLADPRKLRDDAEAQSIVTSRE